MSLLSESLLPARVSETLLHASRLVVLSDHLLWLRLSLDAHIWTQLDVAALLVQGATKHGVLPLDALSLD